MLEENDEGRLPEVADTPEHEEALWAMHMREGSEVKSCPHRPSPNARALLDILASEVQVDDVPLVITALRELADWLEHWRDDGPGAFAA